MGRLSIMSTTLLAGTRSNAKKDSLDELEDLFSNLKNSGCFSFRNSAKLEKIVAYKPRQSFLELFDQRTILNHSVRCSFRLYSTASDLAVCIFANFLARHNKLWQRTIENRRAWQDNHLQNYDQRDLHLIARKVAQRIVSRRKRNSARNSA